jgi:hypothetical protein
MTPQDKAWELVQKYIKYQHYLENDAWNQSKECALIAVEFAREQFNKYCLVEVVDDDHFDVLRQEIEKL